MPRPWAWNCARVGGRVVHRDRFDGDARDLCRCTVGQHRRLRLQRLRHRVGDGLRRNDDGIASDGGENVGVEVVAVHVADKNDLRIRKRLERGNGIGRFAERSRVVVDCDAVPGDRHRGMRDRRHGDIAAAVGRDRILRGNRRGGERGGKAERRD